ncbi:MAG: hypothetical protein D6806_08070 [Deltaproteobacteria bacterium]|nr:MAG: hypothetical protein D6806_08070 [Deltaproteobacteria bacterium]
MATVVLPYSTAKKLGKSILELDAGTVGDLLDRLRDLLERQGAALPRQAAVVVNGVAAARRRGRKTPLKKGDQVWFVLPAGGG